MKNLILLLFVLVSSSVYSQKTTSMEKAKFLIRQEFKSNMDDYSSYNPISFSNLDSLFTKASDKKHITDMLTMVLRNKEKAGIDNLDITVDVTPIIESIEKEPAKYKDGSLERFRVYEASRKILIDLVNDFIPEFIGWKVTHKFRAKNRYNATVLYIYEFRFNKEMTEIISFNDVSE